MIEWWPGRNSSIMRTGLCVEIFSMPGESKSQNGVSIQNACFNVEATIEIEGFKVGPKRSHVAIRNLRVERSRSRSSSSSPSSTEAVSSSDFELALVFDKPGQFTMPIADIIRIRCKYMQQGKAIIEAKGSLVLLTDASQIDLERLLLFVRDVKTGKVPADLRSCSVCKEKGLKIKHKREELQSTEVLQSSKLDGDCQATKKQKTKVLDCIFRKKQLLHVNLGHEEVLKHFKDTKNRDRDLAHKQKKVGVPPIGVPSGEGDARPFVQVKEIHEASAKTVEKCQDEWRHCAKKCNGLLYSSPPDPHTPSECSDGKSTSPIPKIHCQERIRRGSAEPRRRERPSTRSSRRTERGSNILGEEEKENVLVEDGVRKIVEENVKRIAEERRRIEDDQRIEEERRRLIEEANTWVQGEQMRKHDEERRRKADEEERMKQEDERRRRAEEEERREEVRRLEEEEKRNEKQKEESRRLYEEQERKRKEEETRREEVRKRQEEERILQEVKKHEERRRREDERKRKEEEERIMQELKRYKQEEERLKKETEKRLLEQEKKQEEDRRRKEEEDRKLQELRRLNEEEERHRREQERRLDAHFMEQRRKQEEERKRLEAVWRMEQEQKQLKERRKQHKIEEARNAARQVEEEKRRKQEAIAAKLQEEARIRAIEEDRKRKEELKRRTLEEQKLEEDMKMWQKDEDLRRAKEDKWRMSPVERLKLEEQRQRVELVMNMTREMAQKRMEDNINEREERRKLADERDRKEEEVCRKVLDEDKRSLDDDIQKLVDKANNVASLEEVLTKLRERCKFKSDTEAVDDPEKDGSSVNQNQGMSYLFTRLEEKNKILRGQQDRVRMAEARMNTKSDSAAEAVAKLERLRQEAMKKQELERKRAEKKLQQEQRRASKQESRRAEKTRKEADKRAKAEERAKQQKKAQAQEHARQHYPTASQRWASYAHRVMTYEQYEESWSIMKSRKGLTLGYADIPWPPLGNPLFIEVGDSLDVQRRKLRVALLRWHPDKFMALCGDRLGDSEREFIETQAKHLAQQVILWKGKLDVLP